MYLCNAFGRCIANKLQWRSSGVNWLQQEEIGVGQEGEQHDDDEGLHHAAGHLLDDVEAKDDGKQKDEVIMGV